MRNLYEKSLSTSNFVDRDKILAHKIDPNQINQNQFFALSDEIKNEIIENEFVSIN